VPLDEWSCLLWQRILDIHQVREIAAGAVEEAVVGFPWNSSELKTRAGYYYFLVDGGSEFSVISKVDVWRLRNG